MTKQLDIRALLARAPLFASLNRTWCDILANSAQVHRVLKNQFYTAEVMQLPDFTLSPSAKLKPRYRSHAVATAR